MAQRACGYCRDIGHQRPKCPMLHRQRNDMRNHIKNETMKIYRYLCKIGLGPNALIDANVLRWGPNHHKERLLGQVLPYDYEVTRRYYNNGSSYKSTFANSIVSNLYRVSNVKYSKQIKLKYLSLEHDSLYAEIPVLLLDGSNNVNAYNATTYSLYQSGLSNPENRYGAAEGKEMMESLFICPSNDCPDIELSSTLLSLQEDFYPLRIQL